MSIPEKVWVWEGGEYPHNNKRIWTTDSHEKLGDGIWGGDYFYRGDYVEKLEANLAKAVDALHQALSRAKVAEMRLYNALRYYAVDEVDGIGPASRFLAELEKTE